MIKWKCSKCDSEWWCEGLQSPECPDCNAKEIYCTFDTDEEEQDTVMADEYCGDEYSESL